MASSEVCFRSGRGLVGGVGASVDGVGELGWGNG